MHMCQTKYKMLECSHTTYYKELWVAQILIKVTDTLKGLSHEMDFAFDSLNGGRSHFLNFLGPPMVL